ncbi:MAG TPA: poly-gamma-glutamate hydrolase family protein [Actinomycetes bacterium]|nr:poly-gamma-glutamate hydrolase family protein [Actinomycetes bacterium]
MPPPRYAFNTDLYADTTRLTEGIDWARRFRVHDRFDDDPSDTAEPPRTVVLAPHGGGIERGTSELCLAVAGHHPANLPITPPAGVTYDYWMFEGIRPDRNNDLHVTSTGCDDVVAVLLCAGALGAVSLHGFQPRSPIGPDEQVVLVGGLVPQGGENPLRSELLDGLVAAGFDARDAATPGNGEVDGDSECNIVNRTRLGKGAQLELSEPLRDAMFGTNTRPRRKFTTTEVFWRFVAACRDALDRFEARPEIARPDVRCPGS